MDEVLIALRALHFAATLSAAGAALFSAFVAKPAFQAAGHDATDIEATQVVRGRLAVIAWTSLGFVAVTGFAWLAVQTARINDISLDALSGNAAWTVLSDTDFGAVWVARLLIMALFAIAILRDAHASTAWSRNSVASVVLAAALAGSLAFAGHAAAGEGTEGSIHLVSDILHLLAAAAWLGALVPLAASLGPAQCGGEPALTIAQMATQRFSTLGVLGVGTLILTGIINSWVLVGSIAALFETDYGRLLLLKIALFLVMVAVAAINRMRLTPRLLQESDVSAARGAVRQLRINCVIETALGVLILLIVGALGTLPPGSHEDDTAATVAPMSPVISL